MPTAKSRPHEEDNDRRACNCEPRCGPTIVQSTQPSSSAIQSVTGELSAALVLPRHDGSDHATPNGLKPACLMAANNKPGLGITYAHAGSGGAAAVSRPSVEVVLPDGVVLRFFATHRVVSAAVRQPSTRIDWVELLKRAHDVPAPRARAAAV